MDDSAPPHAAVRAWSSTAGSQIQEVLFELNNKVAEEAAEQQAITERMIDDRFAAMRQEMWERLDEVINQMDVQRRDFEEQLAALTQATEGQVADAPEDKVQGSAQGGNSPAGGLDVEAESEYRSEAFRLLLEHVDRQLKNEKADLRKTTATAARALQQDRNRREAMEKRLEQMLGSCMVESAAMRAEMDALRQDVAGQTPPAEPAPQPAPVLDEALAELRARLEEAERSHHGGHHQHHHHHRSTSSVSNDIGVTTAHEKETVDMSVEQVKQSLRLSGAEMDMDGNEATFEAEGGDWDENREQSQWTGTAIFRLPPPAPPRADGRGARVRRAPRGLGGAMPCGVEYRESRS